MDKIELTKLLNLAKKLQKNAYVPYSQFRVASIVSLKDGKQIFGVNVENAAYPATICAERNALAQVIAQGYKKQDIVALFLMTDSRTMGSPCGVCRQFMIEVMPAEADVFISINKMENPNDIKILKVKELLPFAFLPESLKE